MISVVFYKTDGGKIKKVEISGHSGAGDPGEDLICASASTILYTAVGSIEELCHLSGFYRIVEDSDGESMPFAEVWLPESSESSQIDKAHIILQVMEVGYKQLEQTAVSESGEYFVQVREIQYNQEV